MSARLHSAARAERHPASLTLYELGDSRLELLAPLRVQVYVEPEGVTVLHPESEVFGFGNNEAEALNDFREALGELFLTLDTDRESLGPALREILQILEASIRKSS